MMTTSTSTRVVTVMVVVPLEATADADALLSANAGCTRRHSGWSRGPGSVVVAELACAARAPACGAGLDACWATSGIAAATHSTAAILSQRFIETSRGGEPRTNLSKVPAHDPGEHRSAG